VGVRGILRALIRPAAHAPLLGRLVIRHYERRALEPAWARVHPFDREHAIDTSGFVPGPVLHANSTGYGAAQPSIMRRAFDALPQREALHFIDVGCGKGRPLFVAAQCGFGKLTGLEYTPAIATIARRNAAIFAKAHPDVPPVSIVTGDALAYALPAEPLAIFLYNPFDRPATARLLAAIEASLAAATRDLYVVCYNPTWAEVFDGSSVLERRFAAHFPYEGSERDFGPNDSDSVVIWQNRGNRHPAPAGAARARVIVVTPGNRAVVGENAEHDGH
jgi:SAM-dependent methyltransferase